MADGQLHGVEIVIHDFGRLQVIVGTIDQYDGHVLENAAPHHLIIAPGRRNHQAVHLVLEHLLQDPLMIGGGARRVCDQHSVTIARQALFQPADDGWKDGILNIGNHHANDLRAAVHECGGHLVLAISQLLGGIDHPDDGLIADQMA